MNGSSSTNNHNTPTKSSRIDKGSKVQKKKGQGIWKKMDISRFFSKTNNKNSNKDEDGDSSGNEITSDIEKNFEGELDNL